MHSPTALSRSASPEMVPTMTIFIKDLSGHTITMSVPENITISNLTTLLSLRTSLPESSLRLVHAGKHISSQDTDRSLSDCHIGRESTLHLAAPLRGGGPKKIRCTHKDCKGAAQWRVGDSGFCNGHFCDKHRLLEDHKCTGLEDCKKESHERNAAQLEKERTHVIRGI
jgi:hypothetical protein